MVVKGKAQMKFLLATKPKSKSQDPGDSTDTKDFGKTNKKKSSNKIPPALRAAVQRKIKQSGKQNGNN